MVKLHTSSLLILVLLLFFTSCTPTKKNSIDAVLISDKATVSVKTPEGWSFIHNPKNLGICAAYILNETTFDSSPAIMYSLIVTEDIEEVIKLNFDKLKKIKKEITLEKKKNYTSKQGLNFTIRYYLNGPTPNNYEAVGYIRHKERTFLLNYSSMKKKDFLDNINGFYKALDGVSYYSTNLSPLTGSCLVPSK